MGPELNSHRVKNTVNKDRKKEMTMIAAVALTGILGHIKEQPRGGYHPTVNQSAYIDIFLGTGYVSRRISLANIPNNLTVKRKQYFHQISKLHRAIH